VPLESHNDLRSSTLLQFIKEASASSDIKLTYTPSSLPLLEEIWFSLPLNKWQQLFLYSLSPGGI